MSRPSSRFHAPTHRVERVGELVRHALSEILARGEVLDGEVGRRPVTVPAVRMSSDLKLATVSIMPLGGEQASATLEALNRHKKELRTLIAHRINLKFAPDLRFALDPSFDAQARIEAILKSPEVARDLGPSEGDEG
jgi:ribosome-binding factor A